MTNCGASSESCCTSLEVAGGTYYRSYTNSGSGPANEAAPASVSGFRLDKYEVTVGRFRQFVTAWNGGWVPPVGSGKHTHLSSGKGLTATAGGYEPGWIASDDSNIVPMDANLTSLGYATWTAAAGSNETLPINCVNWFESYAFCIWDGGFLPSEAEWEYAAAGGSEQREYPWGSAAPGKGNRYAIYDCDYPSGSAKCDYTGVANIAPVGTATLGAGLWGQLDLAGNVFEWTLDWRAVYIDPCVDCAQLMAASGRAIRGGGFEFYLAIMLPPARSDTAPASRVDNSGFRCARAP